MPYAGTPDAPLRLDDSFKPTGIPWVDAIIRAGARDPNAGLAPSPAIVTNPMHPLASELRQVAPRVYSALARNPAKFTFSTIHDVPPVVQQFLNQAGDRLPLAWMLNRNLTPEAARLGIIPEGTDVLLQALPKLNPADRPLAMVHEALHGLYSVNRGQFGMPEKYGYPIFTRMMEKGVTPAYPDSTWLPWHQALHHMAQNILDRSAAEQAAGQLGRIPLP
jgi:hypothetical protein